MLHRNERPTEPDPGTQTAWASTLPWLACTWAVALHEERESSSHPDSASHSIAATCCSHLAAEAPVPTWVQPCKGVKMWRFWAPSQRAWKQSTKPPSSWEVQQQLSNQYFQPEIFGLQVFGFLMNSPNFLQKADTLFFFSEENTLKKFNFPFKEQMAIENF